MLPLNKEDLQQNNLIVDPLKSYLTLDGNQLREFSWLKSVNEVRNTGSNVVISLVDLENLLNIAINELIDVNLRQTSMDQLVASICTYRLEDPDILNEFIPKLIRLMKSELTNKLKEFDVTNVYFKSVLIGFIKILEMFPTETRTTFNNLKDKCEG